MELLGAKIIFYLKSIPTLTSDFFVPENENEIKLILQRDTP
jgi:hypothetical protein